MKKFDYTNSSEAVVAFMLLRILYFIPVGIVLLALVLISVDAQLKATVIMSSLPLFLSLIYLVRRGFLKTSTYILLGAVNLITTWSCIYGNGIHDIGIIIYPITVLIAVLMLNRMHSFFFVTFTALCLSLVVLGDIYELYEPSQVAVGRWPDVFILSLLLLLGLLITSSHANRLRKATRDRILEEDRQINLGIQIEESLAEKQQLYREVHHRVKNHLAFINSLIDMEVMNQPDLDGAKIRELQSKVVAIARVHDQLYQSDNFDQVKTKTYLEGIISQFAMNYQLADSPIDLKIDDFSMAVNRIIYLGISVHEIISLLGHYRQEIQQLEFILTNEDNARHLSVLIEHAGGIKVISHVEKIEFIQFLTQKLEGKMEIIEGTEKSFIEIEF
jgi:hypothetical protein